MDIDVKQAAVTQFVSTFSDSLLLANIGPSLSCRETEALVDLLVAYGEESAAELLVQRHASSDDDEGDDHHDLHLEQQEQGRVK